MRIALGKMVNEDVPEYPMTYIETDKDPQVKIGDEIPAVLRIKSITKEENEDGIQYCMEAEITEIKGKDASVKSQDEEYDISKKVDEEMDMEMDDSEEDDSEDMPMDKKEKK